MSVFLFVLLALGVARITWLISEDHLPLIAKPRQWIVDRNPDGNLAYLVNCWWCVSVYVAGIASAVTTWLFDIPMVVYPADTPAFYVLDEWKQFLILWPAFSMAAVGIMSFVDMLQAHGTDD